VELAAGDPKAAEQRLRKLRDQFDAQPKIAPLREAASMVTDDLTRMYRPAGYEEVMVRTMLSICSLATDGSDAESYALQAQQHQSQLAAAAKDRGLVAVDDFFQPIAISPYLRGILRESTHHDYDDAARSYQLVSAVCPTFPAAQADIARASGGVHSAPGHGVLYVIACVGRGPVLQESVAPTTTTALAIASATLNSNRKKSEPQDGTVHNRDGHKDDEHEPGLPNIASVKVPKVVLPPSDVVALGARVDGIAAGTTATLTDVGQLAANQISAEMPWTIARAVVRRATKETTVAGVGHNLGLDGSAASIFQFAAGSLWSSTEHADTRCWGMLPREIQALRIELPTGMHQVELVPLGLNTTPLAPGHLRQVDIVNGRNHYLLVIAPDRAIYVIDDQSANDR
ncbi:MAG: hypothetical protein HKN47_29395, partial [Pirellulaceae bacterium]|nr:hypothetical protein [Pirellulaceae bacterium]